MQIFVIEDANVQIKYLQFKDSLKNCTVIVKMYVALFQVLFASDLKKFQEVNIPKVNVGLCNKYLFIL